MTCTEVIEQFHLYTYGELPPEAEEMVEAHLAACADCRAAFAKHRAFLDALEQRSDANEGALLAECRMDFRRALAAEKTRPSGNWLQNLWHFHIPFRVPVGALALVAVGFFAARYTPEKFGGISASLAQPMFSNVQSIQPVSSGNVQLTVDDVQRHVITGSFDEPRIQQLLL